VLRSLLARAGLTRDPAQLELRFDPAEELLARLRRLGMRRIERLVLTRNRTVVVSCRGAELRLQEAFSLAPDEVLRSVVVFVCGRGAERLVARQQLLAWPFPQRPPRRRPSERTHPDDRPLVNRLVAEHARLNADRFGGTLRTVRIGVSRRMRSRLGHYAPAAAHGRAAIVISRRHIRRHGWDEAIDTLLHEMIHQWQEEQGLPVDHGPAFRRKARDVGALPRARRTVR
jgi:hypothetical protein